MSGPAFGEMKPAADRAARGYGAADLLVAITVLFTLAVISLSYVWRAQLRANEANAVVSLRIINTAEHLYFNTYGAGFSVTLQQLGPPAGTSPSADAAGLISRDLASGRNSGYQLTYTAVSSISTGQGKGLKKKIKAVVYSLTADPIHPKITGVRHYYIDESGIVRFSLKERATAASPPV